MDPIRELEAASITAFVKSVSFRGRVLDFGCGRMPYYGIVRASGLVTEYVGFDRPTLPAAVVRYDEVLSFPAPLRQTDPLTPRAQWDVILCTQVIQYIPVPLGVLGAMRRALLPGGRLVITGPTNWPVVEPEDLHRFTPAGIERLLRQAGFAVDRIQERASYDTPAGPMLLGWGAVAVAP